MGGLRAPRMASKRPPNSPNSLEVGRTGIPVPLGAGRLGTVLGAVLGAHQIRARVRSQCARVEDDGAGEARYLPQLLRPTAPGGRSGSSGR
eukprot:1161707-Pyramimonas_sp.AAC.1